MTYSIDVVVTEVAANFDPYGGEYVKVTFGYKLPIPFKPPRMITQIPMPQTIVYKHAMYVVVPKDRWKAQYDIWREFHLIVKDDGAVELRPK